MDYDMSFFTAKDILAVPRIRQSLLRNFAVAVRSYAQYFKKLQPDIELNKKILYEAFGSAYCDMYRLTVFRGIRQADMHKGAAFLVKWIAKLRPIQIRRYPNAQIQCVNELFAITVALTIMNISPDETLADAHLSRYINNLVYLLHYHPCASEQLASELFLLEQCTRRGG
jgi:hypothetical protein